MMIAIGSRAPPVMSRAMRHPDDSSPSIESGTATPDAMAPVPPSRAVYRPIMIGTRCGKSLFTIAGMSTLAIARATPMTTVPIQSDAVCPGRDRMPVPTSRSTSDDSTTRDIPKRLLSRSATGETSAHDASGTAASRPSVAVARPVSWPI
jgi:hypothetical protein